MTGKPGAVVNAISAFKLHGTNLTTDYFNNTTDEGCLKM